MNWIEQDSEQNANNGGTTESCINTFRSHESSVESWNSTMALYFVMYSQREENKPYLLLFFFLSSSFIIVHIIQLSCLIGARYSCILWLSFVPNKNTSTQNVYNSIRWRLSHSAVNWTYIKIGKLRKNSSNRFNYNRTFASAHITPIATNKPNQIQSKQKKQKHLPFSSIKWSHHFK